MTRPLPKAASESWGKGGWLVGSTNRSFPLVSLHLVFQTGATADPPGKEGLSALTARMLERGTRTRTREEIADRIETLGGSFHASATMESIRLDAAVLSRSLDEMTEVLAEMLVEPTFDERELEKLKEEMLSEIALGREEDRDLGDAYFRRAIYGENPYGRFVEGTERSLPSLTRADVLARWRAGLVASNLIAGAAGDIDLAGLRRLLDRHFAGLREGEPAPRPSGEARPLRKMGALLVDKPDRTQTQIFIGRRGLRWNQPDFFPFHLADHAFGGMFTSRLMQEVRVKRGWSYGASSRLELNRGEGLSGVWTFPSNADTIDCIRLLLELMREFKTNGVTAEELEAARGHLLNTMPFEVETPDQQVARRIQERLFELPDDWMERSVSALESVTLDQANEAAGRVVRLEDLMLVMVCTAAPFVPELEKLPELKRLDVVPFDAEDPSVWKTIFQR